MPRGRKGAAAGQAPRHAAQQERTGALMNILLQKFAMSTGAQCRRELEEEQERSSGSRENFSLAAHFIAFHFAAVTQGLPRGLPKRKLSAQFEILLRQVFPSITQRSVSRSSTAPQAAAISHLALPLSLSLFLFLPNPLAALVRAPCAPEGGNPFCRLASVCCSRT